MLALTNFVKNITLKLYNKKMKKILVLPMYGIGDVLMTTPAIRNLKEQSDAEITYLHMFKTTRDILINNPYIDENIHFPFLEAGRLKGLRFLLELRKKYDYSINFYPSNRSQYNIAAFVIGSPVRIGHRYTVKDLEELNFLKNKTAKEDDKLHNVEENLRLLGFLDIKEPNPYPLEIYLTDEEISFARRWLEENGIGKKILIGIHPGTSAFKNQYKRRWNEASFANLIDRLSDKKKDSVILLFGGPEEQSLKKSIVSVLHDSRKAFPVDSLSVREAAALMKKCRLFISNDAGPMHMAASVGIPVVAIFGPTNPVWVKPWGVRHKIIRLGLPCSPCFRYSPKPLTCLANINYACMRDISVDMVYDACMDLLEKSDIA